MLTKDEVNVLGVVLDAVNEGLDQLDAHPEYSAIQAGAAAGVGVSRLPARFRINSTIVRALRERIEDEDISVDPDDLTQVADPEEVADAIYEFIQHGPPEHRAWLKLALRAYFHHDDCPTMPALNPIEPPIVNIDIDDDAKEFVDVLLVEGGVHVRLQQPDGKGAVIAPAKGK